MTFNLAPFTSDPSKLASCPLGKLSPWFQTNVRETVGTYLKFSDDLFVTLGGIAEKRKGRLQKNTISTSVSRVIRAVKIEINVECFM